MKPAGRRRRERVGREGKKILVEDHQRAGAAALDILHRWNGKSASTAPLSGHPDACSPNYFRVGVCLFELITCAASKSDCLTEDEELLETLSSARHSHCSNISFMVQEEYK